MVENVGDNEVTSLARSGWGDDGDRGLTEVRQKPCLATVLDATRFCCFALISDEHGSILSPKMACSEHVLVNSADAARSYYLAALWGGQI
jgi:hypothetical protein